MPNISTIFWSTESQAAGIFIWDACIHLSISPTSMCVWTLALPEISSKIAFKHCLSSAALQVQRQYSWHPLLYSQGPRIYSKHCARACQTSSRVHRIQETLHHTTRKAEPASSASEAYSLCWKYTGSEHWQPIVNYISWSLLEWLICRWLNKGFEEARRLPLPFNPDELNIMSISDSNLSQSVKSLQHPSLPITLLGFRNSLDWYQAWYTYFCSKEISGP